MMGIFLWEEPDGARKWEAYADWETLKPMMAALLERGADPAKMMMSVELRWMCPIKHKGRKTVWIDDIRDICNRNVVSSASSAPDTPVPQHDEGETGWISRTAGFSLVDMDVIPKRPGKSSVISSRSTTPAGIWRSRAGWQSTKIR